MYGFNKVGALFTAGATYRKPLRRLNPLLRCFSSRQRRRRPCESRERKELPPEISRNTVRLTCESFAHGRVCDVYLVGTCHTSAASAQRVKAVIEFLKPQAVFLELCGSRLYALSPPQKIKEPTLVDLVKGWKRSGNFVDAYLGWFSSKKASKLGIQTNEFSVAFEEARKCGAMVSLGDRDINITMARVWDRMPLRLKPAYLLAGLFSAVYFPFKVEELHDTDEPSTDDDTPSFMEEVMVHERDRYMSATILEVARKYNSVVAVVGMDHLRGIQEDWKKPVNLEELLSMPQKKRMTVGKNILTSVGVAVAGFCGIYLSIKIYHSTIAS